MPTVGTNVSRLDGDLKVTGAAQYVDDIDLPSMWHGVVVRTPVAHGRLVSVKRDPAFDWSEVITADASDIPGKNCVAMIEEDVPLIVTDRFRHIGEAVLLIAAPTRELALEARRHVMVDVEELEPVFTLDDAKAARVLLHGTDNVIAEYTIAKGDLAAGFEEADEVVEGTYSVGHQEHMYIEPQGMIAAPRDGGTFDIIGSMQCPYYISKAMHVLMGQPEEAFAIRQAVVGGAFGGKEDYASVVAGYCVVLARKAGRPVKIVYDRDEDTAVTTKRHPGRVHLRTGVKRDGTITAMEIRFELDAGAYVTLTPVVLSRGLIHAPGPYRCANVHAHGIAYATNTPPNGAFRGFGAPQAFFPLEVHIDRVAAACCLDPLAFRKRNCLQPNDTTATGQVLDESTAGLEVLAAAEAHAHFEKKWNEFAAGAEADGGVRRGIGLAFFFHGAGFTGSGEARMKGEAGLRLDADGRIAVLTACTEMGQGSHTVIPQMAADHLGCDLSCVSIETPDTSLVPDTGPTVASRTTMVMDQILKKCAEALQAQLFAFVAETAERDGAALHFQGNQLMDGTEPVMPIADLVRAYRKERGELTVTDHFELPEHIEWNEETYTGDAYPTYAWACDVAEVEVDPETFEVRVKKMWLVADIGRAVNPIMAEGQIEGGSLQAMGYALCEEHKLDGGRFQTDRLQTYIIPTTMDAPAMETVIVEKPFTHGPTGAKGLGELPMDGGAPAIVNAIRQATGLDIRDIPATPEHLYECWKRQHGAKGYERHEG